MGVMKPYTAVERLYMRVMKPYTAVERLYMGVVKPYTAVERLYMGVEGLFIAVETLDSQEGDARRIRPNQREGKNRGYFAVTPCRGEY